MTTTFRNVADYWIDADDLAMLLLLEKGCWIKIDTPGLPDDARLEAVQYSWVRRAFMARFQSSSFRAVTPGEPVEVVGQLVLNVRRDDLADAAVIVQTEKVCRACDGSGLVEIEGPGGFAYGSCPMGCNAND